MLRRALWQNNLQIKLCQLSNLEEICNHDHCWEPYLAKHYTHITVIPLDHKFFVLEI